MFFNEKNQSIYLNQTDISYPNYRNEIFIHFPDAGREQFIDTNNGIVLNLRISFLFIYLIYYFHYYI